jgi:hypothetical protein
MRPAIEFDATFVSDDGEIPARVRIAKVVVGGWTGRDRRALQHHIDELAKIGVQPPHRTPMFYRVGVSRLSTAEAIEVIGEGSSGEVEYVLLKHAGDIWVGAGSDHTDRAVEKSGITVAKQLCDKPIARRFWRLAEIEDHWDRLTINSHIVEGGKEVPYQSGSVAGMLSPGELLRHYESEGEAFEDGTLMFGGTCGVIGDVRFSPSFRIELTDPVRNRTIGHSYAVISVPING